MTTACLGVSQPQAVSLVIYIAVADDFVACHVDCDEENFGKATSDMCRCSGGTPVSFRRRCVQSIGAGIRLCD